MADDINWSYWLGRKYALLGQNADANTTQSNASANLDTVRAGLMPAESAANIAQTRAQANSLNVNATLAPGLAKASEAASYGGARANIAQAGLFGSQAAGENQSNGILKSALGGDTDIIKLLQALRGGGLTPSNAQPSVNGYGFSTVP